ncbi:hypothetical protein RRF57_004463 [Xylaria bambusicola]|uniref:V-type proton ATPase subunit G n=1 Tax=Xylaria bambusicola TaxID=326684 RepID=A0AAN7Z6G9_9PEZI
MYAEREASKIVQKGSVPLTQSTHARYLHEITDARQLANARDEAKKEIEAYRKAKEEEFKKFEAEHTKGNKQAEDEANKEADEKIKEIQTSGKKNQNAVVTDLLKGVLDVKPVPPSAA